MVDQLGLNCRRGGGLIQQGDYLVDWWDWNVKGSYREGVLVGFQPINEGFVQ